METIPVLEPEEAMQMEKIFEFKSSKEHYEADAWIACCFDDRFSDVHEAFKKDRGITHADVTEFAGGALALASDNAAEREVLLNQLRISAELHGTKLVILKVHMDCGANGGSKRFKGDREKELGDLKSKLDIAERNVIEKFPKMQVEKIIEDFDGLYLVD